MNLKNLLRFFIMQNLILLTNLQNVQAFSLYENSELIRTTPFYTTKEYVTRNLESLLNKVEALLPPLAFSLLLVLMLAYWSQAAFFGKEKYKTLNNFIFFFAMASLTLLLSLRWIISRHFPLSNLYESLVFLSLCFLSLKTIFLPRRKVMQKNQVLKNQVEPITELGLSNHLTVEKKADFLSLGLGVILSPLSLLTFGFAFLSLPKEMQQSTALVPALQSNWLMMHVTVMILSYAALLSGSILSIAFLILTSLQSNIESGEPFNSLILASTPFSPLQNTAQPAEGDKLSLLEKGIVQDINQTDKRNLIDCSLTARLDNYSYRILALGFPLLTIGILSGAVWANEAWGSYWSWDPKETWALITWLVFAIYLHTRITKGWSGKKPAIVASFGFLMVWFCYLGVNLLGTGLHSYGWFSNS